MLGTESEDNLAAGFLGWQPNGKALDLGAINIRALAAIQRSDLLDKNPPFRQPADPSALVSPEHRVGQGDHLHARRRGSAHRAAAGYRDRPASARRFCADLALHDWLLSVLRELVERAVARRRPAAELVAMLRPGIDHLVHAWMPAAHASRQLIEIWQEFDRGSAFSLQWQKTVERIRDRLSVGMMQRCSRLLNQRRSESA